MMVARKYLLNNGNTADYFTTSEKVLNEVFADTAWDFNSDSGESEDLSYVEETDNQENPHGCGRGTTCVQGCGWGHDIRQWTERF